MGPLAADWAVQAFALREADQTAGGGANVYTASGYWHDHAFGFCPACLCVRGALCESARERLRRAAGRFRRRGRIHLEF
eukprot:5553372-Pyramimonas_sp.AAC.1